ncbi:hypothetical protein [Pseudooceanicola sp. LIPI14-2-Ac024]|uniref:hypothetical protein n=1 Tax=Pseudooceanicola sp. LIPI14-2-Ac024 TaxID=3344875 RepID=UPI0035CF083B
MVYSDGEKPYGTLVFARDKGTSVSRLSGAVDGLRQVLSRALDLGARPYLVVVSCGIISCYWRGDADANKVLHRWDGRCPLQVVTDYFLALFPKVLKVEHHISTDDEERAVLFLEELADMGFELSYVEGKEMFDFCWQSAKEPINSAS